MNTSEDGIVSRMFAGQLDLFRPDGTIARREKVRDIVVLSSGSLYRFIREDGSEFTTTLPWCLYSEGVTDSHWIPTMGSANQKVVMHSLVGDVKCVELVAADVAPLNGMFRLVMEDERYVFLCGHVTYEGVSGKSKPTWWWPPP